MLGVLRDRCERRAFISSARFFTDARPIHFAGVSCGGLVPFHFGAMKLIAAALRRRSTIANENDDLLKLNSRRARLRARLRLTIAPRVELRATRLDQSLAATSQPAFFTLSQRRLCLIFITCECGDAAITARRTFHSAGDAKRAMVEVSSERCEMVHVSNERISQNI